MSVEAQRYCQRKELTDKDFKITVINMLKYARRKMAVELTDAESKKRNQNQKKRMKILELKKYLK